MADPVIVEPSNPYGPTAPAAQQAGGLSSAYQPQTTQSPGSGVVAPDSSYVGVGQQPAATLLPTQTASASQPPVQYQGTAPASAMVTPGQHAEPAYQSPQVLAPPAQPQPVARQRPVRIMSHNSTAVRHARAHGKIITVLFAFAVVGLLVAAAGYWMALGSPTRAEDLPFLQSMIQ